MQYRRAIQLYYRKFTAYPPNVEALVNTNDIHFLRKKYIDPMTGQDDWKPIAFGQNKTPKAMGFFGQPLAGNASTLAGTGPGGVGGLQGATGASAEPPPVGSALEASVSARTTPAAIKAPQAEGRATRPTVLETRRAAQEQTRVQDRTSSTGQARVPAAPPSAARASSALSQPAPNSRFWSTRRRITTTNGSSPTTRSPT